MVGVFVGTTGVFVEVLIGVLDGRTGVFVDVLIGVLVGGTGVSVFAGVAVGPPGPSREMSSNQMSPVGEPSVIRRSVTLVFDPLSHVPVRNCQLPEALVHSCRSPAMSFISMQAPPTEFVRQM